MWLTFGQEKLILTDKTLEYYRTNRIFTWKKEYSLRDIKSIELNPRFQSGEGWIEKRKTSIREQQQAIPFWTNMGQLILKTSKSQQTILNGLAENNTINIKELLEKEIKKRCPT